MSNVIPAEQLRAWNRQAVGRIALGTAVVLALVALVAILALLPAYINVRAERLAREVELIVLKDGGGSPAAPRSERDILAGVRKRAEALGALPASQRLAAAIELALDLRPKGVRISAFSYARSGEEATLDISGSVEERSLVKEYAEALKGREFFVTARVPLSSLARLETEVFEISASGDF